MLSSNLRLGCFYRNKVQFESPVNPSLVKNGGGTFLSETVRTESPGVFFLSPKSKSETWGGVSPLKRSPLGVLRRVWGRKPWEVVVDDNSKSSKRFSHYLTVRVVRRLVSYTVGLNRLLTQS